MNGSAFTGGSILDEHIIRITIKPSFTRFTRRNHRVTGRPGML
jgi:hypothetical protein